MNHEKIRVDNENWDSPFFAYRIPETIEQDSKYVSPKKLWDIVKTGHIGNLWKLTGEVASEEKISSLLYLCNALGHYVALTKDEFMEGVVSYGFEDSLKAEKIEVVNHKDLGDLVFLNDLVLERLGEKVS